jgi:hypothetical protein
MTGRMNWRRARLYGRPTLDHRRENDVPDRADRWLRGVERRQRERRMRQIPQNVRKIPHLTGNCVTAGSSEVPW